MKKRYFLLSFIIILMIMSISILSVNAETDIVFNIITNPGEDMATSMNVSYQTLKAVTDTTLEYTKVSDSNWHGSITITPSYSSFYVPASRTVGTKEIVSTGFSRTNHYKANLTNLESGTKYMYRVKSGDFISSTYYFETADGDDSDFTFLALSDPQYGSLVQANVFNTSIENALKSYDNIRFSLLAGDIVDRGGRYEQWQWLFSQSSLKKMTYVTTPGNHEYYDNSSTPNYYDDTYYNGFYNNPNNGASGVKNSSYYFYYNGVLFFSINSEAFSSDSDKAAAEQAWFKSVMESHTARYVIVTMHRSFYGYIYGSDSILVRAYWQDLFDEYGVDLVYTGHDHIYSRTYPIYNSLVYQGSDKGTVYVTGGSAGQKVYAASMATQSVVNYNAPYMAITPFVQSEMLSVVSVEADAIRVKAIKQDGTVVDSYEIPCKRSSQADNAFNQSDFEEQTTLTVNPDNNSQALLTLGPHWYGHVSYVKVTMNNRTSGYSYLTSDSQNTYVINNAPKDATVNARITIKYKDGTIKALNRIYSSEPDYGSISDVRILMEDDEYYLTWNSDLINDQITELECDVNNKVTSIKPEETKIILKAFNPYHVNSITLNAYDADHSLRYTETLTYGHEEEIPTIAFNFASDTFYSNQSYVIEMIPNNDYTYCFESSDDDICSLNNNMLVPHKGGTIVLSAWIKHRLDTKIQKEIYFEEVVNHYLNVEPLELTLNEGETYKLVIDSDVSLDYINIDSANPSVAFSDNDGTVNAIKAGTTTLTVRSDYNEVSINVTVNAVKKGCGHSGTIILLPIIGILGCGLYLVTCLGFRRKKNKYE